MFRLVTCKPHFRYASHATMGWIFHRKIKVHFYSTKYVHQLLRNQNRKRNFSPQRNSENNGLPLEIVPCKIKKTNKNKRNLLMVWAKKEYNGNQGKTRANRWGFTHSLNGKCFGFF